MTGIQERGGRAVVRHLITPEYPPQSGGVSDYTEQVAQGLAEAGEDVHVWCTTLAGPARTDGSVHIHPELGSITPADLRSVDEQLNRFPSPRRILVQWVPHGYRYRSMNLRFCTWLWSRSRRGDRIEIMVHEAFLAFARSWRQCAVALVHRVMTAILLQSAERVWVSTPECERRWKPYRLGRRIPFQWQPVPTNIEVVDDPAGVQRVRNRYAAGGRLIGHFGTYGVPVVSVLEPILIKLASETSGETSRAAILLMGMGSQEFRTRQIQKSPELSERLHATGPLSAADLSRHISACDLMIQPYPDGVTTRRGTLMACLNHERAIVTTAVPKTDPIWIESNAVALAPAGDADAFVGLVNELCADQAKRARLAQAARTLYEDRFDIAHTVASLRLASSENLTCVS